MNNNDSLLKQIIAIIAVIFIAYVMYYGTYLPYAKSTAFIQFLENQNNIHSLGEYLQAAAVPLDINSPVGQEELVKNTGSNIISIIQNIQDATITTDLVNFIGRYYKPILRHPDGLNFAQNLLIWGTINEYAGFATKNPTEIETALQAFIEGLQLSPDRPQFLYSLFQMYQALRENSQAILVGKEILKNWPNDTQTAKALAQLESATTSLEITTSSSEK